MQPRGWREKERGRRSGGVENEVDDTEDVTHLAKSCITIKFIAEATKKFKIVMGVNYPLMGNKSLNIRQVYKQSELSIKLGNPG